jgi:ATP-dependent Clp protease ATP-binding subunit ClpA
MLTRFTPGVRSVVGRAYEYALRDRSQEIGEDHLLEGLLDDEEGGVLLEAVAGDAERAQIAAEIEQARRTGGLTATETDALAGLGIDVDAVVGRIEELLGAGALADSGTRPPSRWQRPMMSGTVLRALEEAERQVGMAGGHSLGVEHMALGLVSTPSVLSESLARRGVTVATVRASVAVAGRRGGPR